LKHMCNRYKGSSIYRPETFQMLNILKRCWVVITSTNLRNWNRKRYKPWMTCLLTTFLISWRVLEIHMVKFAKAITRTFMHAQDCTCFLICMYVSCGAYIKTSPSWFYLLGRKDFCSLQMYFIIILQSMIKF
jgi:hypothetical protein